MKKLFSFLLYGAMLMSFAACEEPTPDGDKNSSGNGEYEYVDLGLPSGTLWATYNVGATSPEEYGDYFAWGEIVSKSSYTTTNYKWYENGYTKYCTNSNYGVVDSLITLQMEDDVVTANWGDNWRMPTKEEQQELLDSCTWTWTTLNGVNGYEVKSKNGNSIFLPATGAKYDTDFDGAESGGSFWSSSLNESEPNCAYGLYFRGGEGGSIWTSSSDRYRGRTVRPVYVTYTVTLNVNDSVMGYVKGAGVYKKDEKIVITATPKNSGYTFVGWSDNNTDNPREIVVTEDITLTAIFKRQ